MFNLNIDLTCSTQVQIKLVKFKTAKITGHNPFGEVAIPFAEYLTHFHK